MKKGQAAMEFLTTYAWAFVVALVAIGAMSYFGVWTPENFLPPKCVLETPFACLDVKIETGGEITLQIQYLFTQKLSNVKVNISTFNCDLQNDYYEESNVEKNKKLNVSGDKYVRFQCIPQSTPGLDQKFKGTILVTYTQEGTDIDHTIIGNFQRNVE